MYAVGDVLIVKRECYLWPSSTIMDHSWTGPALKLRPGTRVIVVEVDFMTTVVVTEDKKVGEILTENLRRP